MRIKSSVRADNDDGQWHIAIGGPDQFRFFSSLQLIHAFFVYIYKYFENRKRTFAMNGRKHIG